MNKVGISQKNNKIKLINSSSIKWDFIKQSKSTHPLMFVHTPKCGGSYCKALFKKLGILSLDKLENVLEVRPRNKKAHRVATKSYADNFILFTIIRHPVERFESLLNYRLDGRGGDIKSNERISKYIKKMGKDSTIDDFIEMQTDQDILSYTPYKTLKHYSQYVDIFIQIDELDDFLNFFGYENIPKSGKVNTSTRNYGYLSEKNKARIARLFKDDIEFYNKQTLRDYL